MPSFLFNTCESINNLRDTFLSIPFLRVLDLLGHRNISDSEFDGLSIVRSAESISQTLADCRKRRAWEEQVAYVLY